MEVGHYKEKIGAIIQARMSSTRLPGKILYNLPFKTGKPIIMHIIDSLKQVSELDFICIATSEDPQNDILEAFFENTDINVFRGDEDNVLSRFARVSTENKLDHVIRLTADNPILDHKILKELISYHISEKNDHSMTSLLPIGANISIMSAKTLIEANDNAYDNYDKEHVEPWIKKESKYIKGILSFEKYIKYSDVRLTVDYPSDYAMLNVIFNYFSKEKTISLDKVLKLLDESSWISEINQMNYQKKKYISLEEEREDAIKLLERHEFFNVSKEIKF